MSDFEHRLKQNLEPILGRAGRWERWRRAYRTIWAFSWCFAERYRRLAIRRTTKKSRNIEAEHAAIVRATLKRDADAAVAALSKHFMTTMRLVELATLDTPGSSTF